MDFDYRVIKLKNNDFIVGEVYYDEDSEDIVFYSQHPIECWGEDLELLKEEMDYINGAFEKPILEEVDEGKLVEMV
jgi:hypothetical protein